VLHLQLAKVPTPLLGHFVQHVEVPHGRTRYYLLLNEPVFFNKVSFGSVNKKGLKFQVQFVIH